MLSGVQNQMSARSGMVEVGEYLAAAQVGVQGWTGPVPHYLPHLHSHYASNHGWPISLAAVAQIRDASCTPLGL